MFLNNQPICTAEMQESKYKFYFESIVKKKKTLVVGCGRKIEEGFTSPSLPNMSPCSMNRDHVNDVLIDIDPRAQPDVIMDFGNWEHMRLDLIAPKHFERIDFEYLSNFPARFTEFQIHNWLRGAGLLLAENGVINFISADQNYQSIVRDFFSKLSDYEIKNDGSRWGFFLDIEGKPLCDRQGHKQEHLYCQVRKKSRSFFRF